MTKEIEALLEKIKQNSLFEKYPLYFSGGTALSTYLDHRVSYDIDFISAVKLPTAEIEAFAFSVGAMPVADRAKASAFRINKGEDLTHYHLKFMRDGVKIEFSYFDDPLINVILEQATFQEYDEGKLRILSLKDIVKLKAIALFSRQKARDLYDMTIILEHALITMKELERIYAFKRAGERTLLEYLQSFDYRQDDDGDTSLDFLPHHKHYRTFSKLAQDERFNQCKEMLLSQYEIKQKEKLNEKKREVFLWKK